MIDLSDDIQALASEVIEALRRKPDNNFNIHTTQYGESIVEALSREIANGKPIRGQLDALREASIANHLRWTGRLTQ